MNFKEKGNTLRCFTHYTFWIKLEEMQRRERKKILEYQFGRDDGSGDGSRDVSNCIY